MKQNILGMSSQLFWRKIQKRKWFCVVAVVVIAGLNVLFTCLRTEQTHTIMLIANIVTDSLGACFLIWFISVKILEPGKLYRFAIKPSQHIYGTISRVSEKTIRYMGVDCWELTVAERRLFLPVNTIPVQLHNKAAFSEVAGIVVEVAYDETAHTV